jgi:hypothetical protein
MLTLYPPVRSPVSTLGRSFVLLLALLVALAAVPVAAPTAQQVQQDAAQALASWRHAPLAFVPNQGQTAATVQFQAQSASGTVFFTSQEVVLALPSAAAEQPTPTVRLGFLDANPTPTITPDTPLPGRVNDLRGDDPAQWRTDLPTYGSVVYQDLYAGIDFRYDGTDGRLKGTYTVAPGGSPDQIRWRYQGVEQVRLDQATGDLHITVAADQILTEAAPVAWQDIGEQRVPVHVRYTVAADGTIGFAVGAYNTAYPLVIDPTLDWSTYLGGSIGEFGAGIAVDPQGYVYVTGGTASPDFPLHDPLQATLEGFGDAFITKYSPDGQTLIYSTYLGGLFPDFGRDIAVDMEGHAYIVGDRLLELEPDPTSPCFPGLCSDVFVAKLNAQGTALVYSTELAGKQIEFAGGITVDAEGNAYVTGDTDSPDFPTKNAFQPTYNGPCANGYCPDAFITKLSVSGNIVYSTFLGGSDADIGRDVAVDSTGTAAIIGDTLSTDLPTKSALQPMLAGGIVDAFVTKLTAQGNALVYSTYLGGSAGDISQGIAMDRQGFAYATGYTTSADFPTRSALQPTYTGGDCDPVPDFEVPCQDSFVTKITPDGYTLAYSTYLGGAQDDLAFAVAVDTAGNAYVTGQTNSADFPITRAVQPQLDGGDCGTPEGPVVCPDGYITKLNPAGSALAYSTYVGGGDNERGQAIAVDASGTAYVTGQTFSNDFPVKQALQPIKGGDTFAGNAFVVKLSDREHQAQLYLPMLGR